MPHYLHRTTKQYLTSVSPNSLLEPAPNYIYMPDLSAVSGQPNKYWIITGDMVSLMSQTERDAVDTEELSTQRDGTADQLDQLEDVLRAFALATLDEINILRGQHGLTPRTIAQLKNVVRSKLGN